MQFLLEIFAQPCLHEVEHLNIIFLMKYINFISLQESLLEIQSQSSQVKEEIRFQAVDFPR